MSFFLVCCFWPIVFDFFWCKYEKNATHRFKIRLPGVFTQGENSKKAFHPMTLKDGVFFGIFD